MNLKDLSREDLIALLEVYAKNWLAHDGCWFLAAERRYGMETAIALARGDITAQSVLASGRLHVSGELDSLARHSAALAAVDDVFATVRRDTTFPPADAR